MGGHIIEIGRRFKPGLYPLAAIVVVAIALRLILIGQPYIDAMSWRQTDTAGFARNFLIYDANILTPNIIWNGPGDNHVGYEFQTISYLAAQLYRVFGEHDVIGRSIAVAFGSWKIIAFYLLVRRVWDRRAALAASAILAAMPGEVYVDRLFLPDPVMSSLVMTSAWALVAFLQNRRTFHLAIAIVSGLLGLLTKISGAIVVVPLIYAMVVILRKPAPPGTQGRLLWRLVGAAAIVLVPVTAYYLWALHLASEPPYYAAAGDYWIWKGGLGGFLDQHYFAKPLARHLCWLWSPPVMIAVAFGLVGLGGGYPLPWFFHAWLGGFGLYYLIAARGLVDNPTNLNLLHPAAAALAAGAVLRLFDSLRVRRGKGAALTLIALWAVAFLQQSYAWVRPAYAPMERVDRNLGLALNALAAPGDLVVTSSRVETNTTAIFYSRRRGWVFPPLRHWHRDGDERVGDREAIALLAQLRAEGADWYGLVASQEADFRRARPMFLAHLRQFPRRDFADFTIYDLRRPAAAKSRGH